jgi:hypothetical protein
MYFFLGDTVFIQGAAATPLELVKEMTDYGKSSGLKNVMVCHMHTEGVAGYTEPEYDGKHKLHSLLLSPTKWIPIQDENKETPSYASVNMGRLAGTIIY